MRTLFLNCIFLFTATLVYSQDTVKYTMMADEPANVKTMATGVEIINSCITGFEEFGSLSVGPHFEMHNIKHRFSLNLNYTIQVIKGTSNFGGPSYRDIFSRRKHFLDGNTVVYLFSHVSNNEGYVLLKETSNVITYTKLPFSVNNVVGLRLGGIYSRQNREEALSYQNVYSENTTIECIAFTKGYLYLGLNYLRIRDYKLLTSPYGIVHRRGVYSFFFDLMYPLYTNGYFYVSDGGPFSFVDYDNQDKIFHEGLDFRLGVEALYNIIGTSKAGVKTRVEVGTIKSFKYNDNPETLFVNLRATFLFINGKNLKK